MIPSVSIATPKPYSHSIVKFCVGALMQLCYELLAFDQSGGGMTRRVSPLSFSSASSLPGDVLKLPWQLGNHPCRFENDSSGEAVRFISTSFLSRTSTETKLRQIPAPLLCHGSHTTPNEADVGPPVPPPQTWLHPNPVPRVSTPMHARPQLRAYLG